MEECETPIYTYASSLEGWGKVQYYTPKLGSIKQAAQAPEKWETSLSYKDMAYFQGRTVIFNGGEVLEILC